MTGEKNSANKDMYQKALAAYTTAMKSFRKADFAKAAELLDDFMAIYPSEKELVDRASLYLEICKNRLSKETVTLKTFDDFFQYGVYQLNLGQVEEAVTHLQKALDKDPKAAQAHYLLATAFCMQDKDEECLKSLKTAVQSDGYFKTLAQNDSGFTKLRDNKEFNIITKLE